MKTKTLVNFMLLALGVSVVLPAVQAQVVKVDIPVIEKDIVIDNAGNTQPMWTFGGEIPGPLVRVKQGDTVDFTMVNDKDNKESHSIDFHAAIVDVLDEFAPVKPGKAKKFQFDANYPGVFIYHCGSDAMSEHIGRGMYGLIIVDPKEGYSEDYPEPDREYVLVQGDLFKEGTETESYTKNEGKQANLINGKVFHYDPVHDVNVSLTLQSQPGELVRIFFVNAQVTDSLAFHPIAGIWDRVYDNGNPKNVSYGMQTFMVAPAHGVTFDLISPKDRATNNAIVDHQMKNALTGAITVLMNNDEADPKLGREGNLILR